MRLSCVSTEKMENFIRVWYNGKYIYRHGMDILIGGI